MNPIAQAVLPRCLTISCLADSFRSFFPFQRVQSLPIEAEMRVARNPPRRQVARRTGVRDIQIRLALPGDRDPGIGAVSYNWASLSYDSRGFAT